MKIEELLSCKHTVSALQKANIYTVEQLKRLSEKDLLAIRGIGKVITKDIQNSLQELPVYRLFIIAKLDEKTVKYSQDLCDLVITEKIPGFVLYPHITLATLDVLELDAFLSESKKLFENTKAIPLFFDKAGYHEAIRAVCLYPQKEEPLNETFEKATGIMPECLTQYYDAGWQEYTPHLTLFHYGHMAVEQLREKGEVIQEQFHPFSGRITEIDYSLLTGENQFEIIDRIILQS